MAELSRKIRFVIDINAPLYPRTMQGVLMEGDKKADVLEIAFKDGDTAVKASDVVQVANALVTNMDGQTLLNEGTVGDMISITLKDECYAVPGKVTIDVNVQRSGVERTILTISADVYPNGRGIVIDASGALPSYGDLLIMKQEMQQATTAANTAATSANGAATNANQKANAANTAAGAANTAASTANTAANRANNAAAEVEGSVRYTGAQSLTEVQKQQARDNIYAEQVAPKNYDYNGRDLSTIFTAAQLHEAVAAGNFSQIRNGDYWPIKLNGTIKDYASNTTKTLRNAVFKLEANIQVYKKHGLTAIPDHILFCSRDLLPWTLMFRSEDTTWYDTAKTNPWIGSHLYQTLNAADGILPLVAATDIGAYIYGGENGNGMRVIMETKVSGATSASSTEWVDRGKLFLPSEREVWGADIWSEHSLGGALAIQWPVFAGSMRHVIKGLGDGGGRSGWWCCSSYAGSSGNFCYVGGDGFPRVGATSTSLSAPLCFLFT